MTDFMRFLRRVTTVIKAVLFDLDDTLLDLNLTAFVGRYLFGLSGVLDLVANVPAFTLQPALATSFLELDREDRTDPYSNRELFNRTFYAKTGIPLGDPAIAAAVTEYERTVVPTYRNGIVSAAPRRGMKAAVERVHELGLRCALASNPVFSLDIDEVRMTWADVEEDDFELISTIDNSRRSKPVADYYLDFIGALGLTPQECLMVGNDARRDFPRPDIGLRTLYVGHARPQRAFWTGRPERLAPDLATIVDRANELSAD